MSLRTAIPRQLEIKRFLCFVVCERRKDLKCFTWYGELAGDWRTFGGTLIGVFSFFWGRWNSDLAFSSSILVKLPIIREIQEPIFQKFPFLRDFSKKHQLNAIFYLPSRHLHCILCNFMFKINELFPKKVLKLSFNLLFPPPILIQMAFNLSNF